MDWQIVEGIGKVALNEFSPKELALATGLTTDLQRVWRRRGHLPERHEGYASFDSVDVASIFVRYELSKKGMAPGDTAHVGEAIARAVLYFALLADDSVASYRGGFEHLAAIGARFHRNDELAQRISNVCQRERYIWSVEFPTIQLAHDIADLVSEEKYRAMLYLDLVVIGRDLAEASPKPLFLIDLKS